jgi:hypothetical protein
MREMSERTELIDLEVQVKRAADIDHGDSLLKPIYKKSFFGLFNKFSHWEVWELVSCGAKSYNGICEFKVKNGNEVRELAYYVTDEVYVGLKLNRL